MGIDNERVQTIGRMYHQFFDEIVRLNINDNEWDGFVDNKRKVYESVGLPPHCFVMDDSGSRWIECDETEQQDKDYDRYQRILNDELEDIVIKWIVKHGERGWEHFMTFLNNKRYEFLNDVQTYYLFHGSSYGVDESDSDELDRMMEEFESLPLPPVNVEDESDDDDISVESILQSLREDFGDGEFPDEWEEEDPPSELFEDDEDDQVEEKRDENSVDGEPR